ncbi:unnamed protein product [Brassica oleracea var. botrytis]
MFIFFFLVIINDEEFYMDFKFIINNFDILQYNTRIFSCKEHSLIQYESKIFQEHETVSVLAFCQ